MLVKNIGSRVVISILFDQALACLGVEVAGRTFDRKVEGSSRDINIIGCRQEGHPHIQCSALHQKVL